MATTTNYGWTTPDDTALVKDGAAAIRTLGSSVDTTTKALNPSTTLGDIEYRSSTANTNTRLAIGTSGQVLTVSGGVPAWTTLSSSSGLVFLNKTDFTASSAVNINDVFSTTYDNYKIMIVATSTTANKGQATIKMRVSGADTSTNYLSEKNAAYDANLVAARNEKGTDEGYIGDIAPLDESDVISLDVYRPFLTKETTWIGHNFSTQDTFLVLSGFSQTDKTSFTGFTALFTETSTGSIYSYGYAKA
jgi:hypothetical protein